MTKKEIKEFKQIVKEQIQREGIDDLLASIEEEGFFAAPASRSYHGAEEGGLLTHTLDVYYAMITELETNVGINWPSVYSPESVAVVSLFHDLCKVGLYEETTKSVKTDTGWVDKPGYKYSDDLAPMGHGARSLYMIQRFMALSEEEAQAIYWHMGAFDVSNYSSTFDLSKSYRLNPLAFLLHRADEAATFITANEDFIFADDEELEETEEEPEEIVEEEPEEEEEKPVKKKASKKKATKKAKKEVEPEPEEEEETEEVEDIDPEEDEDILEEDFFYYNTETEEYGKVAKGEKLPEDYDEETWEPVFEEEFAKGTEEAEEPEEEEKPKKIVKPKKAAAKKKPAKKVVEEPEEDEEEEEEKPAKKKSIKKPVPKSAIRKPKPKPRAKK